MSEKEKVFSFKKNRGKDNTFVLLSKVDGKPPVASYEKDGKNGKKLLLTLHSLNGDSIWVNTKKFDSEKDLKKFVNEELANAEIRRYDHVCGQSVYMFKNSHVDRIMDTDDDAENTDAITSVR